MNEFMAKHLLEDGLKMDHANRLKIAWIIKETMSYISLQYDKELIELNQNSKKK